MFALVCCAHVPESGYIGTGQFPSPGGSGGTRRHPLAYSWSPGSCSRPQTHRCCRCWPPSLPLLLPPPCKPPQAVLTSPPALKDRQGHLWRIPSICLSSNYGSDIGFRAVSPHRKGRLTVLKGNASDASTRFTTPPHHDAPHAVP